ncbi:hypothetical protein Sru01_42100 [Sphaerisporangium rufum]|uniref:AAA+ ATPase domain-containing protein n=1 Tax=Sphaerisporangium rufum TaxID=1381558 RepID=A0A919V2Q5_9ACTN|nr:AAA family ATPase [Sphaerisporangium rufum]GII79228.1 hypothetical protein Sru01_42100 [Sphaerisporangium rufum]
MASTDEITSRALFALLRALAESGSLTPQEAWQHVHNVEPRFVAAWSGPTARRHAAEQALRYKAGILVKCGWIHLGAASWSITHAGHAALRRYPDPELFAVGLDVEYRHWEENQARFTAAERLAGAIPAGSWAAVDDVAAIANVNAEKLAALLQAERPEGWRRVLNRDGHLPPGDPAAYRGWLETLQAEGLENINGQMEAGRRLTVTELRQLDDGPAVRRRAWLIRAEVDGRNLVNLWSSNGICSLPANKLRPLPGGVTRAEIQNEVQDTYGSLSYSEQNRHVAEFYAFLSRMDEGDLVLTNDDAEYRIGRITGPPRFSASTGGLANLQRPAEWIPLEKPLTWDDLPTELIALASAPYDVVELTDRLGDLMALIGEIPERRRFKLPNVDDDLAQNLLYPAEWLQECVTLLRERPQLILDGPPGTGKTYLAQRLAEHLTGGRKQNVALIQLHPNYAYEDFFEGYRPGDDGSGGMILTKRDGPLRIMASAAHRHPDQVYVLIIDELNRCNLPSVFGELYFLLEYRHEHAYPQYSPEEAFVLPANLHIIGTMNSADRSTVPMDAAMRRRFSFVELHPSQEPIKGLLRRWLQREGLDTEAADLLVRLNNKIATPDFRIGPSYLMRKSIYAGAAGLESAWRTQIIPALRDLHLDDGIDPTEHYGLEALRRDDR